MTIGTARRSRSRWNIAWRDRGAEHVASVAASHAAGEAVTLAVVWDEREVGIATTDAAASVPRLGLPAAIIAARRMDIGRSATDAEDYLEGAIGGLWLADTPVPAVGRLARLAARLGGPPRGA